jgi:aminopeptidase N
MKSTDIERIDRELRRSRKKEELVEKRAQKKGGLSVGDYIKRLYALLYHDDKRVYNLPGNAEIIKLFADMKPDLPEKQWENVLRKALKETKVPEAAREAALKELTRLLESAG